MPNVHGVEFNANQPELVKRLYRSIPQSSPRTYSRPTMPSS
jgi:hypothetical protein